MSKIQRQDIKTVAELTAAGAPSSSLPGDDQVWVSANSLNKTLKEAIEAGDIGGGGGGGSTQQYIANGLFEDDIAGVVAFADAAGLVPVDGVGGTPNVTVAHKTTTPLQGAGSLLFTKDAANRQGQGWSYDFTIDRADQAQVLEIRADVRLNSGTYSEGTLTTDSDMVWYIYDVTNARIIEPTGFKIIPGVTSVCKFQAASNSISYRLIAYVRTTSTAAYSLEFDRVDVKNQVTATGLQARDFQDYTATLTGFGTPTGVTARWAQFGSFYYLMVRFTSGTPTSVPASVSLPNGAVVSGNIVRTVGFLNLGTAFRGIIAIPGQNVINFSDGTVINLANGSAIATAGTTYELIAGPIQIQGLSSNTVASSETDTRQVNFLAWKNANQSANSTVPITYTQVLKDSHGCWETNNTYRVKVPGDYRVVLNGTAQSPVEIFAHVNGNQRRKIILFRTNTAESNSGVCVLENLQLNDLITIRPNLTVNINGASAVYDTLYIERLSGPAQITAETEHAAFYWLPANVNASNGARINFSSRLYDSTGLVTTGVNWEARPKVSGLYEITFYRCPGTLDAIQTNIFKNNSQFFYFTFENTSGLSKVIIPLLANEVIDLRWASANGLLLGASNFLGTNKPSYIMIKRVGNYV